jgi:hypothetical protein
MIENALITSGLKGVPCGRLKDVRVLNAFLIRISTMPGSPRAR